MTTTVTAVVAAALWLGCLSVVPPWTAAVALIVLLGAVPVAAHGRAAAALALALVGVVLLGGGLAGGRRVVRDTSPLVTFAERRAVVDVVGRVVTEPRTTPIGAWAILRLTRVDDTGLAGRVVLHLDLGERVDVGQRLDARVRIVPLPDGGFGAHLRTLGASAGVRPVGALRLSSAPVVLRWTTIVRDRARVVFARALDRDRAALLGGLVLGTRDDIDDDLLRAAGLSHLVVVSGRHVAVLLAGVLAITALCGVGHRGRHSSALVTLWWFVVLTRWQPSVLRAAVMATLMLVAALSGRGRDALHGLAVTVLLLLLCDPLLARQAGFALSVLATGGVLLAVQHAGAAGAPRTPVVLRATVAAQLATAPVLLAMVGTVPLAALPANLVAAPAATTAQVVGLCAAALAATDAPGAVVLASGAGPPLAVLEWAAGAFSGLPALGPGELAAVVALIAAVAVVHRRIGRRRPARWTALLAAATAVAVLVGPLVVPTRSPAHLRLVAVDVGQGDALLIEAPDGDNGARMLVDGGPEPGGIDAALRSRRIREIEAVVLTHGDHDHAGGLARVLRRLRVGMFVVPLGDPALQD
ncbi:MAG TPA: ComEC/Rec2 family competence protein, partial [Euzebyales bacterium]|nr:ComEC/Rec2 family competence protein [Euzebyales bacterium]